MKIKKIEVELTEQECKDILTTAIESNAIQYWAREYGQIEIWRDTESNIYQAKFAADNISGNKTTYTVTTQTIQAGVDKLLAFNQAPAVREMILDEDIDSEGADCIIQFALFDGAIYG